MSLRAILYTTFLVLCSIYVHAITIPECNDNDSIALFQHPWFDIDSDDNSLSKTIDFATIEYHKGYYKSLPNADYDGNVNYLRFYFGNIITVSVSPYYYIKSIEIERLKDSHGQYTSAFSPDATAVITDNDTIPFSGVWTCNDLKPSTVSIINGNSGSSSATRIENIMVTYASCSDAPPPAGVTSNNDTSSNNTRLYYNITGQPIARPTLPGIYIVREPGKTHKIIIR